MEGLGVSLLQAAAAGVPLVATRVGGIPEIVHHQKNGLLIEPRNPDALTQAATAILTDPTMAIRMGQSGRELVKRSFSLENMVSGNRDVYRRILKQAPPREPEGTQKSA
jgi:glycosyltransferase involved in cell wall biosynthesis